MNQPGHIHIWCIMNYYCRGIISLKKKKKTFAKKNSLGEAMKKMG